MISFFVMKIDNSLFHTVDFSRTGIVMKFVRVRALLYTQWILPHVVSIGRTEIVAWNSLCRLAFIPNSVVIPVTKIGIVKCCFQDDPLNDPLNRYIVASQAEYSMPQCNPQLPITVHPSMTCPCRFFRPETCASSKSLVKLHNERYDIRV